MVGHAGYRVRGRDIYYFVYGKKQQKPCIAVRNCLWQLGKSRDIVETAKRGLSAFSLRNLAASLGAQVSHTPIRR